MSQDHDVAKLEAPPWALPKRDLAPLLARAALSALWTARHPREPFVLRPDAAASERLYYQTLDGWESALHRLPPLRSGRGEPVVLWSAAGLGHLSFDYASERSLARRLQQAGYDVFLPSLRGSVDSVAPDEAGEAGEFDFDDMVSFDVPAVLERVRELSGCGKVLWVGHGLGGQLLYGHLAHGGVGGLAGAVSLCAPVRFEVPRSRQRLLTLAARLLPRDAVLPVRTMQRLFATWSEPGDPATAITEGPVRRGLMVHAARDVNAGLLRQVGTWLQAGHLCDRHDRLDYVAALSGCSLPLLLVAAPDDTTCPPEAARPVAEVWDPERCRWWLLPPGWGHIDALVGDDAGELVHGEVVAWLEQWREACWSSSWP